MAELVIQNAIHSFGWKQLISGIDLRCATGDLIGIYGRNGSGKSTLLKLIFGTLRADHLSLKIDDVSIRPWQIIPHRWIGYLPQDPFLPAHLKVRDVIPLCFSRGVAQDAVFHAPFIERMATKKIGNLSLGERRYLEVVLIGQMEHPFLLLDEPFSMIEPLYKDQIKEFLHRLASRKGIIMTDHYYQDVLAIANKNYVLSAGKLLPIQDEQDLQEHGYLR
ncbi:ATP-binding cassette domain-containing protein [Croceiramulus getboli]|nr:ATP-binding cassette domain-containing protein [Flavobacteriaceae bacterium YJPT1-3]